MRTQAVVFDLDGTLLDSLADIANAGNAVLAAHGFPTHSLDAYRYFVGDGVAKLIHRLLPVEHQQDLRLQTAILREYADQYQRTWNVESRLYDGVPALLDELVRREIQMAVLSNKPQAFTELCVAHYLPGIPFVGVLGQHSARPPKPDPAGVREIAARLQAPPSACLYLGDTGVDMQTARSAGMIPVGATWGFRDAAELVQAGAQHLIDHPGELLPLLAANQ
jgi:phosphoglycolate phosphatase